MKGSGSQPVILWFRRDLRLDDLPALAEAVAAGNGRVVPLFVADPALLGRSGPNRRRFLAGAVESLNAHLGGDLCLRAGNPGEVVPQVAAEVGAKVVLVSGDYAPYGRRRDAEVASVLAAGEVELRVAGSAYVHSPGTVRGAGGGRLKTFSSYFRAWERLGWPAPRPAPDFDVIGIHSTAQATDLLGAGPPGPLACAGLPDWWEGLPLGGAVALPDAGEQAAAQALKDFLAKHLDGYPESRDMLGSEGTSHLSPYLRFGCVHPRTVLEAAGTGRGADRLRAELVWREFYADVLWHEPRSAREPLQSFGRHLRWDTGAKARDRFRAWATGGTGFPLVDAGMRQLLLEGWVHNRARMVAASFLVKDLQIDWRWGARWFMWHLVDGDLASNQHGWQWVAGTGTDAAPFHRVFNPDLQQDRFDRDGTYVRRYLGSRPLVAPIVDHLAQRKEALQRFEDARAQVRGDARSRAPAQDRYAHG